MDDHHALATLWPLPTALPSTADHAVSTMAHRRGLLDGRVEQAVGFADMSGFTELSRSLTSRQLMGLIRCFEHHALEVVAAHGGRLVKFIGDEVMFVAEDVRVAVDIALTLRERLVLSEVPVTLHCGISYGPMVSLRGDVFGHTVNVASRLCGAAGGNDVLVARHAARRLDGHDDLCTRPVRRLGELKGIGRTAAVSVRRG